MAQMYHIREAIARVREGTTVSSVTAEVLGRIAAQDAREAWSFIDSAGAASQARDVDAALESGAKSLPLAGVTVGVKDIFAIRGVPTRAGSPLTPDTPAPCDAKLVAMLRDAGAVIMGATGMPEFALGVTAGAKNPHNPAHTPGSSSTGCAIAVARGQVPLALAMQTNASIIRPASFCGVAAFKPSQGALPIEGAMRLAPGLDQPGFMAADLDGLATVYAALVSAPVSNCAARSSGAVAFARTPVWDKATAPYRARLEALAAAVGAEPIEIPGAFAEAWTWLDRIMEWELAENLSYLRGRENELAPPLRGALERSRQHTDAEVRAARDGREALRDWALQNLSSFDCVVTPAATGPAPRLEHGAGSPVFSTIWNLMGAPCLCLPAFTEQGLPVGVQLTAAPGRDDALLDGATTIETAIRHLGE